MDSLVGVWNRTLAGKISKFGAQNWWKQRRVSGMFLQFSASETNSSDSETWSFHNPTECWPKFWDFRSSRNKVDIWSYQSAGNSWSSKDNLAHSRNYLWFRCPSLVHMTTCKLPKTPRGACNLLCPFRRDTDKFSVLHPNEQQQTIERQRGRRPGQTRDQCRSLWSCFLLDIVKNPLRSLSRIPSPLPCPPQIVPNTSSSRFSGNWLPETW